MDTKNIVQKLEGSQNYFEKKRILVTGAGQGIGKQVALRLSQLKAEIFALSKTQSYLDDLKLEDPKIKTICVDLLDWEETRESVRNILPIDLLVNNAGVGYQCHFLKVSSEEFDKTFGVNVKAILNVSQIVAKHMIDRKVGGVIVNLSSQASKIALENHAVYGSSKAAVDMLTKVMALELGPHNIRVNAINPTVVMTKMGRAGWNETSKDTMLSKIPLGRFPEISEIVDVIVYLLSDQSTMISGVCLPVDGGFLASSK